MNKYLFKVTISYVTPSNNLVRQRSFIVRGDDPAKVEDKVFNRLNTTFGEEWWCEVDSVEEASEYEKMRAIKAPTLF